MSQTGISPVLNSRLSFKQGDAWRGMTIRIREGGSPPAAAVQSCVMIFKEGEYSPNVLLELSSAAATITITSAANWEFTVPRQLIPLPTGTYAWCFRATDINSLPQTYLQGTMEITAQF